MNLLADNLFITNYRSGRSKITSGVSGALNTTSTTMFLRMDKNVKKEEFVELLKKEVLKQKLSIITELSKPQKKLIVETLLQGDIELPRNPKA